MARSCSRVRMRVRMRARARARARARVLARVHVWLGDVPSRVHAVCSGNILDLIFSLHHTIATSHARG